jgi:membrane-associated protease RseP (regulator of RpoE activity)
MRRFQALLISAGLAAAPAGAAAGPTHKPDERDRSVEVVEWSMAKGRLGITVMGLTPELRTYFGSTTQAGLLVASVEPSSPAAKAGVRVGDVIVETNGQIIDDVGDIRSAMAMSKKGDVVDVDVIRDRKPVALKATLTENPSSMPGLDAYWRLDWLHDLMKSVEKPKRPTTTAPTRT